MMPCTKFGGVLWRKFVLYLCVGGRQANWGDGCFSEWTKAVDVYRWCFGLDGVLLGGYSHNYSNFLNLISARP